LVVARAENNKQAEWSFDVANQVEEIHAGLFKKVHQAIKDGEELNDVDYYVCKVCGNTVESAAQERCSICGAPEPQFIKIE
jgi:rubrerythrin